MILIKDRHLLHDARCISDFIQGNMILIKDRHLSPSLILLNLKFSWGNMILIKDRHVKLVLVVIPEVELGEI